MRWSVVGRWGVLACVLACSGCATDADGDGFAATVDCDDGDADVYPGATELCDGVDRNCDGQGDLGAVDALPLYEDADGDGFGDPGAPIWACATGAGVVDVSGDCDDGDPAVFPGALTLFEDRDGDGFGDDARPVTACGEPIGTSPVGGDCDDGQDDVHPGALETCNGLDDDCDSDVDEGAVDALLWFTDGDGDGVGEVGTAVEACTGTGASLDTGDCDDTDATVYPGAPELCDGVDDDCNGAVDDGAADADVWYPDSDGDGYGWVGAPLMACSQPAGFVADATDCNDAHADDNPAGVERCDGRDNDCDGTVDGPSALGQAWWYADNDGDGFGDPATAVLACEAPVDHGLLSFDCDDGDPAIRPLVAEVCDDGIDNDCSGAIDDCGGGGTPVTPWPAGSEEADLVLTGETNSSSGSTLAVADRNDDGTDDLLVGGSTANGREGAVWVLTDVPSPGALDAVADARWRGTMSEGEEFGELVGNLGDLDGDGLDEVGVTAPKWDGNSGGAYYLMYGSVTPPADGGTAQFDAELKGYQNWYQGVGLGSAGDLDGDGYGDAAFAARDYDPTSPILSNAGGVYLLYGSATRFAGDIDEFSLPVLVGENDDALCFGTCIAAGDLDGDGLDDMVFAGRQNNPGGKLYYLYGSAVRVSGEVQASTLPRVENSDSAFRFARALVVPGDVDGDGYPDLVAADPTADVTTSGAGAVWVVPGGAARLAGVNPMNGTWDTRITALEAQANLGWSVAAIGDQDGDGGVDLVLGAPYADGQQPDSGVVAVFTGLTGGDLRLDDADQLIEGEIGSMGFGFTLAHGDFDGSGVSDLVVGTGTYGIDGDLYYFLDAF